MAKFIDYKDANGKSVVVNRDQVAHMASGPPITTPSGQVSATTFTFVDGTSVTVQASLGSVEQAFNA